MISTGSLILSCILWVKGDFTTIREVPISESMAVLVEHKAGFTFKADVIEERLNSMEIIHKASGASTFVYTFDSQQKSLYAKITVKDAESSLSCEIK